jgi:glycosyltransferase involved in cell wall biosynthesis
MSILYATRSYLPSQTANSVQSAHMADAWARRCPGAQIIYRTKRAELAAAAHFEPYGIAAPRGAQPLKWWPLDELHHAYLLRFAAMLRRLPSEALVYTRSARMARIALKMGRTTVLELHDPLIPIRIAFLKKALRSGQMRVLVVTTERLKQDVIDAIGWPSEQILVVGGGAAAAYADLPAAVLPQRERFAYHVGYAGSALKGKGVSILMACAEVLPDFAFHLIGPTAADCLRFGALPSNVMLHGYQTGSGVVALLKSMDVLLLPNQPSVIIRSGADIGAHTSPLKLFEYMTTGRPIIASDLAVFDSVLTDSVNCLRVNATASEAFVAAIRRLQAEPALGMRLAANALEAFKQNYTWDHRVERIIAFLAAHGIHVNAL